MMSATEREVPPRDVYFDNVRAILIVFVVIGHLLQSVGADSSRGIVFWIYSFHMPAFVLVSGYLSRNFTAKPHQVTRLVTGILLPYLLFQFIHAALRPVLLDKPFTWSFITPFWTLWFLLALVIWRLATPLITGLRFPVGFALAIALIAPLDSNLGPEMSLARVLGFLPYYVVGMLLTRQHFQHLHRFAFRCAGAIYLTGTLLTTYVFLDRPSAAAFFLNRSYEARGEDPLHGIKIRVIGLVLGFLGTLAILAITGCGRTIITRLGQYSLFIYLLHPLVFFPIKYMGWLETWTSAPASAALVLMAVAVAFTLASPPLIHAAGWLVAPRWADRLTDRQRPYPLLSKRGMRRAGRGSSAIAARAPHDAQRAGSPPCCHRQR